MSRDITAASWRGVPELGHCTAIAHDLKTAAEQLAELGWSPEESAIREEKMGLCSRQGVSRSQWRKSPGC